ncbi:RNase adapter RapZ [Sphingoaurantiacus capsulatus]|uniref:RNase adapter RapZ n=1 Tax=Sphingoaurantiacus capsulatus TaxID=1771310 RepID=A0ABV7X5R7_9SPHN
MTVHRLTTPPAAPNRVLLVTGLSGAGKSTVLKALEDLGYEAVDNMPLRLLRRLIGVEQHADHPADRPLAIGIDTRTRAFNAEDILARLKELKRDPSLDIRVLYLDCSGGELTRRFSETRRRHPLALDRPAADGIARERELLAPLRQWADIVLDTTDYTPHDTRRIIREKFGRQDGERLTLTCMSFGFARGLPRDADLVFDMRFLANPHWVAELRPLTGRDAPVGIFIESDPAYDSAFARIRDLIVELLPRYQHEGKTYLTAAFGCTGGRHRSVYVTEAMAKALRAAGFEPNVLHRDIKGHGDDAEELAAPDGSGEPGESKRA